MEQPNNQLFIPGDSISSISKHHPGPGTHTMNGQIYASIPGSLIENKPVMQSNNTTSATSTKPRKQLSTLSISRPSTAGKNEIQNNYSSSSSSTSNILPEVDSVVLARVTRINSRQANVAILVVGENVCADEFPGIIRVQDVRATEKDKVKIFSSFRPGDIVRAQVISLGDQSNYYLSTASNHFGVLMAWSEQQGNLMEPVSWKEFRDPVTKMKELRKVAKPF